jgi:hypothetical protein
MTCGTDRSASEQGSGDARERAERELDRALARAGVGEGARWAAGARGLCNTRFINGHKPSNHIRARIKSHVYTTE